MYNKYIYIMEMNIAIVNVYYIVTFIAIIIVKQITYILN